MKFQKGVSGNPGGRKPVDPNAPLYTNRYTMRLIAAKLKTKALRGDQRAIELLLQLCPPKPPAVKPDDAKLDLSEFSAFELKLLLVIKQRARARAEGLPEPPLPLPVEPDGPWASAKERSAWELRTGEKAVRFTRAEAAAYLRERERRRRSRSDSEPEPRFAPPVPADPFKEAEKGPLAPAAEEPAVPLDTPRGQALSDIFERWRQ